MRITLTTLTVTLFLASCTVQDNVNCEQAICTDVFSSVNVNVVDNNGDPVVLNNVATVNAATGDSIFLDQPSRANGNYVVLDDSYVKQMYNQTVTFMFVGTDATSGKTLFAEPYTITADCCHVGMGSGKETIVIK